MEIVDLTPSYLKFLGGETSFEDYRSSYPILFDHYRSFWNSNDNFIPMLTFKEVESRRALLLRNLANAQERLRDNGLLTENLNAVLFVGNHRGNGHAFLDDGKPIAWFAIECIESELEAKIFTMHELIHALHYWARPELGFNVVEEQRSISRQLITEGIATYLTKRLWDITDESALWADSLSPEQLHSWMTVCRSSERKLFEFVRQHFDSSDPSIELFYAANPNDIFSYRAGYYVGLKLIESIASQNDFSEIDLLNIPMNTIKQLVCNELQMLISK